MVLRLRNRKSILPRLYRDCAIHVEEISLLEESYLWHNVQVYVVDSASIEDFLILHSPSSYSRGRTVSAYMTAQKPSVIEEFSCILRRRQESRMHLQTSADQGYIRRFVPWLSRSYTVRYFRADASTFKQSCQHRSNVVKLTPQNVKQLYPSASPSFIKRLQTASVYGYLSKEGELASTSGVGWLTKKSFSISYTETKPEYRGRGIAKCLTSLASEPLIRKGLIGVYAADVTNPASMAVAEGLGFKPYRDLKCFYN